MIASIMKVACEELQFADAAAEAILVTLAESIFAEGGMTEEDAVCEAIAQTAARMEYKYKLDRARTVLGLQEVK